MTVRLKMIKRLKQELQKLKYPNGKKAHEKVFSVVSHQRNTNWYHKSLSHCYV